MSETDQRPSRASPFIARPIVLVALLAIVSAVALTALVAANDRTTARLAAAAFAGGVIIAAMNVKPFGHLRDALARLNAFNVLTWAWGSLALFGIYLGTDVTWQHGWQYASAMALIAIIHAAFSPRIQASTASGLVTLAHLALVEGIAAALALGWLASSGKLVSEKGDWPANIVFVTGAIAVIAVTAQAYLAYQRAKSAGQ